MAVAVAARGYGATRVSDITTVAGVSRRTFYEHFENKEACFLAAFSYGADLLVRQVRAAYQPPAPWPDRLRAGLAAFVMGLVAEPDLARMCLVEVLAAGPQALELRRRALESFAALLDDSQRDSPSPPPPPLAFEVLVGGICEAVYVRLQQGNATELLALIPDLTESVLLPLAGVSRPSAH